MNVPKSVRYANITALILMLLSAAFNLYTNGFPGLFELIGKAIPIAAIFLSLDTYKTEGKTQSIFSIVLNVLSLVMYGFVFTLFQGLHNLMATLIYSIVFFYMLTCFLNLYFLSKIIKSKINTA